MPTAPAYPDEFRRHAVDLIATEKLSMPDAARRLGVDRRIGERDELRAEVAAWEKARNAAKCRVDWQFTTADARIKPNRLYPSIQRG